MTTLVQTMMDLALRWHRWTGDIRAMRLVVALLDFADRERLPDPVIN